MAKKPSSKLARYVNVNQYLKPENQKESPSLNDFSSFIEYNNNKNSAINKNNQLQQSSDIVGSNSSLGNYIENPNQIIWNNESVFGTPPIQNTNTNNQFTIPNTDAFVSNFNAQNYMPTSTNGGGSNITPKFNKAAMTNWYGGLDPEAMSAAGWTPEQIAGFSNSYKSPLESGLAKVGAGVNIAGGLYGMLMQKKQSDAYDKYVNKQNEITDFNKQRIVDAQKAYDKSLIG